MFPLSCQLLVQLLLGKTLHASSAERQDTSVTGAGRISYMLTLVVPCPSTLLPGILLSRTKGSYPNLFSASDIESSTS